MNLNILFFIMLVILLCTVVNGYKKGMVKELISVVSLIITCMIVAILGNGVRSYFDGKIINAIAMVLLICLIGIIRHLLGIVFFSAKVISKLPVVSFANKLLGAMFGVLETILLVWTLYLLVMMFDIGIVGQMFLDGTRDNRILSWLYQHNYLAYLVEKVMIFFAA